MQAEFDERVGADKTTISGWERGQERSRAEPLKAIHKLRYAAVRRDVTIPS